MRISQNLDVSAIARPFLVLLLSLPFVFHILSGVRETLEKGFLINYRYNGSFYHCFFRFSTVFLLPYLGLQSNQVAERVKSCAYRLS